ncbi:MULTISPECIES: GlxA family transcriptional regulator [Deefgea]|uniref:Helix-turn-helix domain-containing protein n=1 Tax=Deefgea chitinilytica TaxID=570276 RepID=A0ABS2CAN4_9NEIS|nr:MULTISPECIES: helix-turn-helix domain-containing protein [Deefgea]MBM5571209.1 helix-turn-helix domain-containing protein [Deefgea chitinilytica]MBM9888441.1 helix-turn-helix domain-containing protein [Deefgea sp. CFH1-16]
MTDLYFVLTPNFMLLDLAGPAEAFQIAANHGAPYRLHHVAPVRELTCSIGLKQHQLALLPTPIPHGATIVLIGTQNSKVNLLLPEAQQVVAWLREHFDATQHQLACVCSGTMLAAYAGLLDHRECTTHHEILERLRIAAPLAKVLDDRIFVQDGNIATSAGICSGIDLALQLIEQDAGPLIAQAVAREMVVWLRRSGQDPQLSPWLAHRNHLHPMVHKAQDLISRAPRERWTLDRVAAQVHTSGRNLARLFQQHCGVSLHQYHLAIRIATAKQLLNHPQLSIEHIAEQAGFASARDFRRVWQKETGLLPSASRQ